MVLGNDVFLLIRVLVCFGNDLLFGLAAEFSVYDCVHILVADCLS